jgi:ABC-type nitrate/sulfonate/bicarbonate transport system substrate-binding protein
MTKRLAALAAGVAAFALFGSISAQAGEKVMMGRTFGITQFPGLVAQVKGYFKEQGLDVEYKQVPRGNVALGALATGNLQFAESAHAPFLAAVTKDAPLIAVGVATRGFQGKLVAAPKNTSAKSLADFKGKHVGIQVGTGVHTVILMLLERKGLKPSDFKFTNIRVVDMPAAMSAPNNPFDAVIGWEPGMTRIVQAGHGKMITEAREFEKQAEVTYPFLISTTVTYHKEHPDIVQKVLNAYAKADKFIREHHEEAVKIFTDDANKHGAKLTEDIVRVMLFDTDRFGGAAFSAGDMKDLKATSAFMVKTGKLKSQPPLDKVIDPKFAEKADAALTQ